MTASFLGPVASCGSCRAPIRWAQSKNGKAMPIDFEPAEDGNVVLERPGATLFAHVVRPDDPRGPRYKSHHATCPRAAAHRRRAS